MKRGRPKKFKGHALHHRRHVWRDHAGRTRTLFARWRENLKCWECCISGYSIPPHRWYAGNQTTAQCNARLIASQWGRGWQVLRSIPLLWDGRPDELHPRHQTRAEFQYDMFPLAVAA